MQLAINSFAVNIDENVLKVGGAVLSGDFFGNMINRRAERASDVSHLVALPRVKSSEQPHAAKDRAPEAA
jgi:hypothetical protein